MLQLHVLSNPQNTVIGNRSFGSDCHMVSDMVLAELERNERYGSD